jgi:hypothetical protein
MTFRSSHLPLSVPSSSMSHDHLQSSSASPELHLERLLEVERLRLARGSFRERGQRGRTTPRREQAVQEESEATESAPVAREEQDSRKMEKLTFERCSSTDSGRGNGAVESARSVLFLETSAPAVSRETEPPMSCIDRKDDEQIKEKSARATSREHRRGGR